MTLIDPMWMTLPALLLGLFAHFKLRDSNRPNLWFGLLGTAFLGLIVYDLAITAPYMQSIGSTPGDSAWFVNAVIAVFPLLVISAAALVSIMAVAGNPMPFWEISATFGIGAAFMVIFAQGSTDPGQASLAINLGAVQGMTIVGTMAGWLSMGSWMNTIRRRQPKHPHLIS